MRTTEASPLGVTKCIAGDSIDADILLAAKCVHERLDRLLGKHIHNLSGAIRASHQFLSKDLALQLLRLSRLQMLKLHQLHHRAQSIACL